VEKKKTPTKHLGGAKPSVKTTIMYDNLSLEVNVPGVSRRGGGFTWQGQQTETNSGGEEEKKKPGSRLKKKKQRKFRLFLEYLN